MQIVLPPEVEALVQRQLTSGKYNSAIEVILAGVKLKRSHFPKTMFPELDGGRDRISYGFNCD